jgi:hypothetical protein
VSVFKHTNYGGFLSFSGFVGDNGIKQSHRLSNKARGFWDKQCIYLHAALASMVEFTQFLFVLTLKVAPINAQVCFHTLATNGIINCCGK